MTPGEKTTLPEVTPESILPTGFTDVPRVTGIKEELSNYGTAPS